ncbi:unnamed protein product [Timema podura]|uniref:Uncharacterized protein n=1 Tax=Timema podura TaxID=61482 RepID=A0ABN7P386_TIMPD|nr:unnamed protein product [Timema podura]
MKRSVEGDIRAIFVRKNVMDKLADQDISTSTNTTTIEIPSNISTHPNDIGHCVGRVLEPSDTFRCLKATCQPESGFVFPDTQQGKQQRRFQKDWL